MTVARSPGISQCWRTVPGLSDSKPSGAEYQLPWLGGIGVILEAVGRDVDRPKRPADSSSRSNMGDISKV